MIKTFKLGLSVFLAVAVSHLGAEEVELTPQEQWTAAQRAITLPAQSAWRLDYTKTDDKSIAYHPEKVESVRMGATQRDVVQWDNGKTTESWWLGPDIFSQSAITIGLIYGTNPWPQNRFPLAAWITPENLKGLDTLDGSKVIVFETHLRLKQSSPGVFTPDEGAEAGPGLNLAAYIDPKKEKVVEVKIDGRSVKVTWQPAPSSLPEPPAAIVKMKEKFGKLRNRLTNSK